MKLTALFAAASALAFSVAAQAQEKVVNVYNWNDYIDEQILADFTAETGIKVVYDVFDTNELLETKLLAGGTGYDLVVPTGTFLARQIQAGVFKPLDKSKLPNLKNMWDAVSERTEKYDPGNQYSINYMWGTTGIGYNVAKVKERLGVDSIDSWSVLFDPAQAAKLADCGIIVMDAPDEVFRAALKYLGLDPNTDSEEDFKKATDLLLAVRPSIQKFSTAEYISALAGGDICLAMGYSGDMFQAQARAEEAGAGIEIAYVIPKEGANMWFDQMAIPADAPNPENAHILLDYLMRPEVIAKASNYTFYANGNIASKEFLDPAVRDDPAIYPTPEVVANLFVAAPIDAKLQRTVTRLWSQVRTGQ